MEFLAVPDSQYAKDNGKWAYSGEYKSVKRFIRYRLAKDDVPAGQFKVFFVNHYSARYDFLTYAYKRV